MPARVASRAGWLRAAGRWLQWLLLACAAASALATPVPATPDQRLRQADRIKLNDNATFLTLVGRLDAQAAQLTPLQRDWLAYLHAWQLGFRGQYPQAQAAFDHLLAHATDPNLRARARVSLIDDQVNSAHYEAAYANLNLLLADLPRITDHRAHYLALSSASALYGQAGQYELALQYVAKALAYDGSDHARCISLTDWIGIQQQRGSLRDDAPQIGAGLAACQRDGNQVFANIAREAVASWQVDHGRAAAALALLQPHDAEVLASGSSALASEVRATLARAFLHTDDLAQASRFARSAITLANQQTYSKASADGWQVLYQIAKRQGDDHAALASLEAFAAADKGYLDDIGARAIAYQVAHLQMAARKAQIQSLDQQNQVLRLQQDVARKNLALVQLGVVLALVLAASIALYAWRTRRAQRKFQQLAQRDGLTGIHNRPFFIESAQAELAYCAKSMREASVIAIDLDHFKQINDDHGHAAGDAALKEAVAACRKHLRSVDVFGRLGGEEFAILLPDCPPERATGMAEAMRREIVELQRAEDGPAFPLSASFGIGATRWAGYELAPLLAQADDALYQAKRTGRNRVVVHAQGAAETTGDPREGHPDRRAAAS